MSVGGLCQMRRKLAATLVVIRQTHCCRGQSLDLDTLPSCRSLVLRTGAANKTRKIPPLCLRVQVRARRAPLSFRSVLNHSLSFLNVTRGNRHSHRLQLELDMPEDAGAESVKHGTLRSVFS